MTLPRLLAARDGRTKKPSVKTLEAAREAYRSIDGLKLGDLPSAAAFAEASAWQVEALHNAGPERRRPARRRGGGAVAGQVLERRPAHMAALRRAALIFDSLADSEADNLHLRKALALDGRASDWEAILKLDPSNQIALEQSRQHLRRRRACGRLDAFPRRVAAMRGRDRGRTRPRRRRSSPSRSPSGRRPRHRSKRSGQPARRRRRCWPSPSAGATWRATFRRILRAQRAVWAASVSWNWPYSARLRFRSPPRLADRRDMAQAAIQRAEASSPDGAQECSESGARATYARSPTHDTT